jgi:hypothetical protein
MVIFYVVIQHCFVCRPSDSTVSGDAEIEPRTVATLALTARRSNQSAGSHLWLICRFLRQQYVKRMHAVRLYPVL